MTSTDKYISVNNEVDFVQTISGHHRVVALVYATWCPFCIRFLPVFQKHCGSNNVVFLLAEDNQERIADQYEVDVIPTVLFFENGVIRGRLDGGLGVGLSESELVKFFAEFS